MSADERQFDPAHIHAETEQRKRIAVFSVRTKSDRADVAILAQSERDFVGVIDPEPRIVAVYAELAAPAAESKEGFDRLGFGFVTVGMVEIGVEYYSDVGREHKKRTPELARFGDKILVAVAARVLASDMNGRVKACRRRRGKSRSRGFAVRTRYRYHAPERSRYRREVFGTFDCRNSVLARRRKFGIVRAYRSGKNDEVCAFDVIRIVSARRKVGTARFVSESRSYRSERAHAHSFVAYKVYSHIPLYAFFRTSVTVGAEPPRANLCGIRVRLFSFLSREISRRRATAGKWAGANV